MITTVRVSYPPVTFVICAYNQEAFIDHAILGAFQQDYPNLEIILSDDASSDHTYAKMVAAAVAYDGPHRVVTRRNARNEGILSHVYHAAKEASGDLIVLAAGDDVSLPQRTMRTVAKWLDCGCDAIFSAYEVIDGEDRLIAPYRSFFKTSSDLFSYFAPREVMSIHGASSAYPKSIFSRIPEPEERIMLEDAFFSLMIPLFEGKTCFINEPLVRYREHVGSLSNSDARELDSTVIGQRERLLEELSSARVALLRYFERSASEIPSKVRLDRVRTDISFYAFQSRWISTSFSDRVRTLVRVRRSAHLHWLLPRMFGLSAFVALKRLKSQVQKKMAAQMHA